MRGAPLVIAIIFLSTSARADDIAVAREHYQRGNKLYDLQRYAEAAKEYEAAYEIKDDPALLFNIGQAYRFAGDDQKAVGAFRSYLRRLPHASNREEVEARIKDLQDLIEQQKKSQEKPPSGPIAVEPKPQPTAQPATAPENHPSVAAPNPVPASQPVESHGRTKRIAGLAVGGVGVVGVVLGATFYGLASVANHDLNHPAMGSRFDPSLESRMNTYAALGPTFLAIGGAALVTGVVVYVMGRREGKEPRVSFVPSVSTQQVSGAFNLEF